MVPSHPPAPVTLRLGRTTLLFEWNRDRWHHGFSVQTEAGAVVWRSIETWRSISVDGEEAPSPEGPPWRLEAWPPSPPLVELWAGPPGAILGVGRAGQSHFSLSATVDPRFPDTVGMEWACRLQGPPGRIGSAYEGPHGRQVVIAPPSDAQERLTAFPATLLWSYRVGPDGIACVAPAEAGESKGSPPA